MLHWTETMAQALLSFGILLILAQVVLSDYNPDEYVAACNKETGYDDSIQNLNYSDPSSIPRSAKCHMACFMGKQGVMRADGTVNKERATELYRLVYKNDENKLKTFLRILNECVAEYEIYPDLCDTALSYVKCKRTKFSAYN